MVVNITETQVEEINSLVGKKYKFGEKGPDYYDCYTILVKTYEILGVDISGYEYDRTWIKEGDYIKRAVKRCEKVTIDKLQLGDIIIIASTYDSDSHAGMCVDNRWFIHCTPKGVVRSRVDRWKEHIKWCGRPRELIDG